MAGSALGFRLKILIHLLMILLAAGLAAAASLFAVELGSQPLWVRALVTAVATILALAALRPCIPWLSRHLRAYVLLCLAVLAWSPWYHLVYLAGQAGTGIEARQLAGERITQSTSNGIIEIGFAYPVFTPTISLRNNEPFTRAVDVYLRIIDGNNEPNLFRAVRARLPDGRLSVEASINGLLSGNPDYLFIPVAIPPRRTVEGRLVFIISNLNDGSTFDEALTRSYQARFELRDPESGALVSGFPLTRI